MYKLFPYFTNDGSVGLYSPDADDIYHSAFGAASEAFEKFILPANFDLFFMLNCEIKILDICFGIGYNSKSFLNYFLKNHLNSQKNLSVYNDEIYTDNQYNQFCSVKIYSDNNFCKKTLSTPNENFKIYIKAIDTDYVLAFLSPFILTGPQHKMKKNKLLFENKKINKFLAKPVKKHIDKNYISYPDDLNIILLDKIINSHPEILTNNDIIGILSNKKYKSYFNASICRMYNFYKSTMSYNAPQGTLKVFLHNIYYNHITNRYKKALNSPLYNNLIFDLKINDARYEIRNDTNMYNFIFLDAFTPSKCPMLWTVDFFKLLFKHLDTNGVILTYTNSVAVRSAFLNAGFAVGKIFNPFAEKFIGTIAVKNKSLIKYELSNYDLGLLQTKAGIFYRDINLNSDNSSIIEARKSEVENSKKISSSKFIKEDAKKSKK